MKATFFERLGSYFLDTIIVSLIFSIICLGVGPNISSQEALMEELDNQLMSSEITPEEYIEEYSKLLYDVQKDNVFQSGISVALTIAYFAVFQYMNKGQTIGKKILKLRVVDKDTNKPISILKGLLRSFIVFNILSGTLNILFLYIMNRNSYFVSYGIVAGIETIFILVTIILVLYKKDQRGLHDIMANTIVVKESR